MSELSIGADRLVLSQDALTRLNACGDVVWRAPAEGGDAFVEMRIRGDHIVVNAWNGWQVRIDAATGAVLDRRLVK